MHADRFHPYNLAGLCGQCNRFSGGKTYEFDLEIDRRYRVGWALFLEKLAREIDPWSEEEELGTLRDAARRGANVYEQTYFMLRAHHSLRKSANVA